MVTRRDDRAAPGLEARELAVRLLVGVLARSRTLEEALEHERSSGADAGLEPRDRGFAHLLAATVLRRHGSLSRVVETCLERPLPDAAVRARLILLTGAAQLVLLGTAAHAAISLAVDLCRRDNSSARFGKLVNAVLRRVSREGTATLAAADTPRADIPEWLWARWTARYGSDVAAAIAAASLAEAPLDISVKADAADWAQRLGGALLSTGSIRLHDAGRVEALPGFADGDWWVQDAAAALPARMLGDVAGKRVADLCAAPGGKTAALAAGGALVTAVDRSPGRVRRLADNMERLKLTGQVTTVVADLRTWEPDATFDAVLLDAPCTATGTIRRHPDILHLKRPGDVAEMARLQQQLLERTARWVAPGGYLLYCTCSLEPEEGEAQIAAFLSTHAGFEMAPVQPQAIQADAAWFTTTGALRTLPSHRPGGEGTPPGLDGFYAARLRRIATT